ncbi:MAG: transcription termination factor NusA [Erysipelotrichaceae bacterium]|nr:transcription termination factor NusA [Erysipelotrichaceae bacterium]
MNFKDLLKAMHSIEETNMLSENIVIDALSEAISKAYRKHIEIPDVQVRVEFNQEDSQIHVFQQRTIVEEVEDEELEISLFDAKKLNPSLELGQVVEEEVSIDGFGRAAVLLAKNVLKQKIREAQKQNVYDEYIDKVQEMVTGVIDKVEDRFVLVNLDKAQAMMPRSAQMPQEKYKEGQRIRVIISEVNKDTKGSQVLVSRADANLVKRLFELEVPEIYQGVVEIKAIAREVGERTKMAVYSHKPEVDAIGACIGPRGSRVQVVIEELKGEKIDIFEWSDDVTELIKNALSPAHVLAVLPVADSKNLLVVVEDDQLSLAIGKKGKNVRLAVNLTGMKIDIKTKSDVEAQGIDWKDLALQETMKKEAERLAKQAEEARRMAELEQQREQEALQAALSMTQQEEETTTVVEDVVEKEEEKIIEDVPLFEEVEEKVVEKRRKPTIKPKVSDYVSKFEALADASRQDKTVTKPAKSKNNDKLKEREEDRKIKLADMLRDKDYSIRPEYSEEELEEIRRQEELESQDWYEDDIDYDEFDSYYDEQ